MNSLQIFDNPEFGKIRVIELNGEPWFVGRDVAFALGYAKPENALAAHVPDKYKKGTPIQGTLGGTQNMTVINEAGLYKLVMRSKLPNAEKFSDWTCEVVLPSIRKNGFYVNPNVPIDPEFLHRIADEIDARNKKIALLETQVAEMQPKASYYDIVLNCPDLVTTSQIAKDYGMSAKSFNRLLHNLGVQFNQGGIWLLYQKYARLGWTSTKIHSFIGGDSKLHCKVHTYWTQKGRLGLYELLKDNDYLPTVERDAA